MKYAFVAGSFAAMAVASAPLSSFAGGATGGVVVGGNPVATITGQGTSVTTINQSANQAIINWQQFSIGAGDTVKFVQPSANAIALNRVLGGDLTQIYGTLQANGRVIVINPNGIMIGPGGMVDTKGFIASTLDVPDNSFLSGGPMLFSGKSTAAVQNQGTIRALGGDVFLIAHTVQNSGTITAPQGTVGLAAGSQVELVPSGDERISVLAGNSSSPAAIGVDNSGAIAAASAELKAAGGNIYALAINNGGVVRATGIVNENGHIYLRAAGGNIQNTGTLAAQNADGSGGTIVMDGGDNAANPSTVINYGTIDASGTTGGTVEMLGDNVGLFDNALVNVSGAAGGGTALIGGDLHGANPNIQDAEHTYIGPDATIKADALAQGNGGEIVVWSDNTTRDYGTLSAMGGAAGGNGGYAEVSSKGVLDFDSVVDLNAPAGNGGTLLLDPFDITVSTGGPAHISGFTPPGDITEAFTDDSGQTSIFQLTGNSSGSFGGVSDGATIVLQAQNNINVNDTFNIAAETGNNNVSLDLQAGNNITINAAVTANGTGTISLSANDNSGGTATGTGAVSFGAGGSLATAGGAINVSGASISLGGGSINAGTGIISLDATSGGIAQTTGALSSGGLLLQGAGTFNLANTANSVGTIAASVNGPLTYEDANPLTVGTVLGINGIVSGGNAINVSTVNATLTVSQNVNAGVDTVNLTAGSTGGADNLLTISPGVTVSGATGVTLAGDNMTIDQTAAINAGGSTVFLAQAQNGTLINLGGGNGAGTLGLSQTELNTVTAATLQIGNANSGALAVSTPITAPAAAGTLSLESGSTITQNTGAILNVTGPDGLNLKSGGAITLNEANPVANLSITGAGGAVQFTDAQTLTLGIVTIPGQTLTLNTSGGNFALNESGFVTAGQLNLNNWGATTLNQANQVAALNVAGAIGTFQYTTAAPTLNILGIADPGQSVTLNGSGGPTVTESGIISATSLVLNNLGTTTLNQANLVPNLTITGGTGAIQYTTAAPTLNILGITEPGQSVTINGSGSTTVNGNVINAGTLVLNNLGTTTLNSANTVAILKGTGLAGTLQFTDAQNLDVQGLSAPNQTVDLTGNTADSLSESAGTVTAGTLNLTKWVAVTMNQANQVGALSASSLSGTAGFQFGFGAGTTDIRGIVDPGQTITFTGNGASSILTESVPSIAAGELDLNGLGNTSLNVAAGNAVGTLKIANPAGTTQFTDAENLTIGGITATGQTVVLSGGGNNLGQTGGITAGELDLDSWSGMFLTLPAGNQVGVLKVIGGGGQLSYNAAAGNLDLQGISDPGELLLLTGSGAGSTLTETAGAINANELDLTAFGTTTLNQANAVGIFQSTAQLGALQFTDNQNLNVKNVAAAGQTVSIAATGDNNELTVLPGFNVTGSSVTLAGDRISISGNVTTPGTATIKESTAGRQITIGTDDVSAPTASGGTLGLTIPELASITAGTLHIGDAASGNLSITTIIAPATFPTLYLQSGATIAENPGTSITIGNLAAQAGSGISLTTGNSVTTLAATTPGMLQFVNSGSLTVGNVGGLSGIQAGGGADITTQSGTLTVSSGINGPGGVTLTANDLSVTAPINSGGANTIFQPFTAGISANFGSPIAGDLNLTQAELNEVTANVLQIGNNLSGAPVSAQFVVAPITVHQLLILGGNSSITLLSQQLAALSAVETPAPTEQVAQFSSASLTQDEVSKILPAGAIGTIWLQLPFPHENTRVYKIEDVSKWTSGPIAAVGSTAGPQQPR